jgi:aspartate-semialdehyde dehydrogenase
VPAEVIAKPVQAGQKKRATHTGNFSRAVWYCSTMSSGVTLAPLGWNACLCRVQNAVLTTLSFSGSGAKSCHPLCAGGVRAGLVVAERIG